MSKLNLSILIFILINLYVVIPVHAVTNTFVSPTCLSPSYDDGQILTLNAKTVSANGNTSTTEISSAGAFTPQNSRIIYTRNVSCAISDPVVRGVVPSQSRIWGITETGVLFYTDATLADFSLGFYNLGTFGISCSGAGGNCNPIHVVANLSTSLDVYKIGSYLNGTSFVSNDAAGDLYKYPVDAFYAPILFFDMSSHVSGTTFSHVVSIESDSSGNIHVLAISTNGAICGAARQCVDKITISPTGTLIAKRKLVGTAGGIVINSSQGGLVLDETNPTQNYTYVYRDETFGFVNITHNSSAGDTVIALTPFATVTEVNDMEYNQGILYVSSRAQNSIFAYATNFTGYTIPGSGATGIPEITYEESIIDSLYSNYYNDSNFEVYFRVSYSILSNPLVGSGDYKYKVNLIDPNGVVVASHFSPSPSCGLFTCSMNETLVYSPPTTGWQNGSWSAKLYEYNVNTFNLGLLDTSNTWNVLNVSAENRSGTITDPSTDLQSGSGAT